MSVGEGGGIVGQGRVGQDRAGDCWAKLLRAQRSLPTLARMPAALSAAMRPSTAAITEARSVSFLVIGTTTTWGRFWSCMG